MSLLSAIAVSAAFGCLALRLRVVSSGGAIAGGLLAFVYATASTPAPFAVFALFVALGSAASKIGVQDKRRLGVAQENEGRRGVENVVANGGVGAAVLLSHAFAAVPDARVASLAACGAIAACLSDTIASEWGMWKGGVPRHVLSWKPVAIGTDGAVSLFGAVASAAAAILAGLVAACWLDTGGGFGRTAMVVAVAGYAGNLADTLLGATVEARFGRAGNSVVNFTASLTGAAVAGVLGAP